MSSRRRLLPALVGLTLVAAAVGGFIATRSVDHDPSDADVQSAASTLAGAITARLEGDAQLLATAAAAIGGDPGQSTAQLRDALGKVVPGDHALGIARGTTGTTLPVVVAVPDDRARAINGLALASRPEWQLVLELARDEAAAGSIVLDGVDGRPAVLVTRPLYGAVAAPGDIAGRRQQLEGFVVTEQPASAIVGLDNAPASDVTVRVVAGSTVLGAAGRDARNTPPSSAVTTPITANGVAWTVQAWATPAASPAPWFVLCGGLLLALLIGVLVHAREQTMKQVVAETAARGQELALVARAGPILQQSLAMGDLLPVFVVEVGDELHLDSTSISLFSERGELVRVFSLGSGATTTATSEDSLRGVPKSVAPGEIVTVPLQRAGRVVGLFQARAVAGLGPHQMNTLSAVCALLASAIGNARLYEDEQDLVVRLRGVDKLKTGFIGSVSHELRTSVTAIQGFADLLESSGPELDAARRSDFVERISRNARSLNVLVEDLLDFARFERTGLAAALRPIDLSELVPTVVDQMSSVLGGREVTTTIEPGVVAMADTMAVERILANLLSNAGKYTPPASRVTVTLSRDTDDAVISVSDRGPGVPVDEREKIFDLFFRSDESARTTRGIGIGLALARQLVTHLDGTIAVDDAPGGGARFRVTIPLAASILPTDLSAADEGSPRSGGRDVEAP